VSGHFGTGAEVSVTHFGTSAEMSGHFGTITVVPKCLRSEVSWVRSVDTAGSPYRSTGVGTGCLKRNQREETARLDHVLLNIRINNLHNII